MNWELFIAKRIHFGQGQNKNVSPPAIRIAIAGVALGLAVMILSVAIVIGFKQEIREKVIGFGSHIQITAFDSNTTYETPPIQYNDSIRLRIARFPEIRRIAPFITKPAVIKTDNDFMGGVLKGTTPDFDWSFFDRYLTAGQLPAFNDSVASNQILISKTIADKMRLQTGDAVFAYFIKDKVRARKFTVSGIYHTGFSEYDQMFILGDARQLQRLNNWNPDQYSGIEILLHDFDALEQTTFDLYADLLDYSDEYGTYYYPQSIRQISPTFFGWLDLLDFNVWIILILMSAVAGFTMISGLLIIILERVRMIGILKAEGASNRSIRKIFLYVSAFLVGKGLLWGNLVGILLCLIQKYFKVITLDPGTYYVSYVPIELNIFHIILLNVGCLSVSLLMLVGPSYLVSLIRPAKSIKFE